MLDIGQLTGTVKHYDWGGSVFIPSLLALKAKENRPYAEYWLGTHPQADCRILFADGSAYLLSDYLSDHASDGLGDYVYNRFGNLPYLLKALDVQDMLSIQVHPSRAQAEKDFEDEDKKNIPLDSPQRNYKDKNHKPELMVAMGEFWLLHGFRPVDEMEQILNEVPELRPLIAIFEIDGYAGLYRTVMEMSQEEVNEQLQPLLDRIIPLYKTGKLDKSQPDYWAAKGALSFSQPGKTDRGIFSVYLFNLLRLNRGQAIFQDAGVPHAYLQGWNIEIMASSDNVLRGGLTNKHIDVKELLKHVRCEATYPDILEGTQEGKELVYKTPAPDFELSTIELAENDHYTFHPSTTEILLLVEGEVMVEGKTGTVGLKKGSPAAVVFPGNEIKISASQSTLVFRAGVPVDK